MQRARSAVDFSSILNPSYDSEYTNGGTMSTPNTVIKPNGPLPGSQASETPHELPRPYKCPLCDKAFHRLEHQTRHIRTHTGEKPHACQFPGCSKKFSRSDELTRHSRIHNNPNARRGNRAQQQHQQHIHHHHHHHHQGLPHHAHADGVMAPPPGPRSIRSAPTSTLASPDVSPRRSFASFAHPPPANYHNSFGRVEPDASLLSMDLTRAVTQIERDSMLAAHGVARVPRHHPYFGRGTVQPRVATYLARHQQHGSSHAAYDDDDHFNTMSLRHARRSRPNSPNSTAPSSPTFSLDSLSPTPDHTPIATPAHSPRIRPYSGYELPTLRNLSLLQNTAPALAPLEPHPEAATQFPAQTTPSRPNGVSLADILSRPDGSQRKLPVPQAPKVAVQDLLSDVFPTSGRSSTTASQAGGDLLDRM